jgi:uncharacterized protein (DUF934 family)
MPELIKDGEIVDDRWQLIAAPAAVNEPPLLEDVVIPNGAVILPLSLWQAQKDNLQRRQLLGVWLNSDQPPELIANDIDRLQLIAIYFPQLTDGRGFSYARALREHYRFSGELRAIGHFMRDQLFYLQRCGFNAFSVSDDARQALALLKPFNFEYQSVLTKKQPLFKRSQ